MYSRYLRARFLGHWIMAKRVQMIALHCLFLSNLNNIYRKIIDMTLDVRKTLFDEAVRDDHFGLAPLSLPFLSSSSKPLAA